MSDPRTDNPVTPDPTTGPRQDPPHATSARTTPPRPGLVADLQVRRDGPVPFDLDACLTVAAGEVLALLGPNGAGKSTALACLAGLLPLTGGSLQLAGRTLDDPSTGLHLTPQQRRVGVVFQDQLLFPHLSARDNVAFGLRSQGTPRQTARARAQDWLDRVGVGEQAAARPGQLSGGQAQRVALARALAPEPDLLLLDEPLSALDAGTRMRVRTDLRRHLDDFTGSTVLVTHDPLDALVLADRIVVLERGQVVQTGTPAQVARAPRTQYVGRLVGLNLYRGRVENGAVRLDAGGTLASTDVAGSDALAGQAVFAAFRPSAVALHDKRPHSSARNVWAVTVSGLEQHADTVRVQLDGAPSLLADVTTGAVAELGLSVGRQVWAAVKATEVNVYAGT